MSLYEGMFLLDNRQANRDWDGSLEKLKGILTKHGSEIVRVEKWGERKLAYEIEKQRRATYVLIYFKATGDAVTRIYRDCELSEMILRTLVIRIQEVPPEGQRMVGELLEAESRLSGSYGGSRPVSAPVSQVIVDKPAGESPAPEKQS